MVCAEVNKKMPSDLLQSKKEFYISTSFGFGKPTIVSFKQTYVRREVFEGVSCNDDTQAVV